MKTLKIALIILLVVLVTMPLFGQRRGRRARVKTHGLAISIYGGLEDLTGETTADTSMYFSFGSNIIFPLFDPLMFRAGLANISIYDGGKTMMFGTGFGGDLMYYFPVPMVFEPYAFGGLWYTNISNGTSTSTTTLRLGIGAEMSAMYNFFVEAGMDYMKYGDADALIPFSVHGGMRFPLFR
jgi:opacity protein-like surface antigen